jgi:hypothetical protein
LFIDLYSLFDDVLTALYDYELLLHSFSIFMLLLYAATSIHRVFSSASIFFPKIWPLIFVFGVLIPLDENEAVAQFLGLKEFTFLANIFYFSSLRVLFPILRFHF